MKINPYSLCLLLCTMGTLHAEPHNARVVDIFDRDITLARAWASMTTDPIVLDGGDMTQLQGFYCKTVTGVVATWYSESGAELELSVEGARWELRALRTDMDGWYPGVHDVQAPLYTQPKQDGWTWVGLRWSGETLELRIGETGTPAVLKTSRQEVRKCRTLRLQTLCTLPENYDNWTLQTLKIERRLYPR